MRAWEGKHPDKCSVRAASSGPAPSPHLPPAPFSAPDPLRAPQDESWLQKDAGTWFLPARVGLFMGWEELRVPAGVARAGAAPSLREFRSLGERDKGDGKHGGCCGSGLAQTAPRGRERDGERHLSVPHPGVFLRGFPQAVFPRALPGSPAPSQRRSWGLALLLHTRTVLGPREKPAQAARCGCRAPPLPENGPPVNAKSLPVSGKFKPMKTLRGTAANKYDLSHQEPPPPSPVQTEFQIPTYSCSCLPHPSRM